MTIVRNDKLVGAGGSKYDQKGLVVGITDTARSGSLALDHIVTFGTNSSDSENAPSDEPLPTNIPAVCQANTLTPANNVEIKSPATPDDLNELVLSHGQTVYGCTVLDNRTIGKTLTLQLAGWNVSQGTNNQWQTIKVPVGDLFTKK